MNTTVQSARPRRRFTASRILALVLVAGVLGALAYLAQSPASDAVTVPEGAKAGGLNLEACDYTTEDGVYQADCGTLTVPENRNDPQSRLIAVRVTRIPARSEPTREPLFRLEGGPGASNMTFPEASRYAEDRDVVIVGYRGIDSSTVLDCPEVESALKRSTDYLAKESFDSVTDAFGECADRHTEAGVDLAGYSLAQQADDLEAARAALGYDKIDLISESTGTRLAMIYAWRYPASLHRSAMIGVNPPGHFLWDGATTDAVIRRYAQLCDQDEACRGRTDDLAESMRRTAADMPERWWFLPIKDQNVRLASFAGLYQTTEKAAPMNGPMVLDSWLAAAEGDPSGFWFESLGSDVFFPEMFVWGEWAAIGLEDGEAAKAYFDAGGDHGSILGNPMTDFAWSGGRATGAWSWPVSPDDAEYAEVRTSDVDTLLISGELDVSTPPEVAKEELLPHLPNGHQVVLSGFGHTASFWAQQPDAGTHLVTTFLDSGRVDDSRYEPEVVDLTPGVTQATIAKIAAGTMVALALLTVLSLLWWMPRKVHKRGRFGAKTSALARSLYAFVLGLGGWFLGLLVVMTVNSGVPLDSSIVAALSVGTSVGLGICWAWTHREWTAGTKTMGLAASVAGGIAGAWLGLGASDGLPAGLTAIPGAVAVANLAVILLDIAQARPSGGRRAAEAAMNPHQEHAQREPATESVPR